MDGRAKEIIDRFTRLKGDRAPWESLWEDVCTFVAPRRGGIISPHVRGASRMSRVFSCTAIDANDVFAAGLYGHLCSPPWFQLQASPGPEREISEEERLWFSVATTIVHAELAASNFNLMLYELFRGLGSIGTGCLFVEEGKERALNFHDLFVGNFVLLENSQGILDTLIRKIVYTARQAVQEFGIDSVGPSVRDAYNDPKKIDELFEFIHEVAPREKWSGGRRDKLSLPYSSIYVGVKDKLIVKEGGYYEMPFMGVRLDKESEEIYGRGIGVKMLPEIKLLNKMRETTIRAAEKVVDPPLQVPHDGFLHPLRTIPGGIMYFRSGTTDRVQPLETNANLGLGLEMEKKSEEAIKDAWFYDLWKLLAERKNMTATEVLERVEEKLVILGPMLGRLQGELFNPMIERCVGLLHRTGRLPPPPPDINIYSIVYTGKLAMAMRQAEVRSAQSTVNLIAPWAQTNPEVLDNFDHDKIVRGISERLGVPGDWLRTPDDVAGIREKRAQAQQAQQASLAAIEAAKVMPDDTKKELLTNME